MNNCNNNNNNSNKPGNLYALTKIMGCFASKPEHQQVPSGVSPVTNAKSHAQPTSVPTANAAAAPVAAAAVPRSKVVITETDRAKLKLKQQRDRLEQNVRKSETVLQQDLRMARTLYDDGRPESAKILLRRRRLVQKRIAYSVPQLDKIEASLGGVESAERTAAVLEAIEKGTQALNKLNAAVTLERAEQILAESEDALAYTNEVANVLARADSAELPDMDEDELLKELEQFEEESKIASTGAAAHPQKTLAAPALPSKAVPVNVNGLNGARTGELREEIIQEAPNRQAQRARVAVAM